MQAFLYLNNSPHGCGISERDSACNLFVYCAIETLRLLFCVPKAFI